MLIMMLYQQDYNSNSENRGHLRRLRTWNKGKRNNDECWNWFEWKF